MSEKKSGFPLVILVLVLIALGGGYYAYQSGMFDKKPVEVEEPVIAPVVEKEAVEMMTALPELSVMTRERVLGFPNAPIKVREHSSLTCSHCGSFHKNTFEQFKRDYIVTGKAYLVFSDFPLNAPALYASMVSRCIPEEYYFDFIQELFLNQDDWAFDVSYLDYLQKESAKYGLGEDLFKECTDNQELRQSILANMQKYQQTYEIRSTPSFVVNDEVVLKGALSFDQFKREIEAGARKAGAATASELLEKSVEGVPAEAPAGE